MAWLLAPVGGGQGLAVITTGGVHTASHWSVPLEEPEVWLPPPRVKARGGPYDVILRPAASAFYLCKASNKVPQRRRLPSASREPPRVRL